MQIHRQNDAATSKKRNRTLHFFVATGLTVCYNTKMEMKEIFRKIVDNTMEGVIIIDNGYRIKYMNHRAGQITGFTDQKAVGKYCYEILRAKRCKGQCPFKDLGGKESSKEIIVDIITRDNSEKFIKATIFETHGHWVEVFHDITREMELEKQLNEKYIFRDIITRDKKLLDILREFPNIAASPVPVLLEGESGSGKEVFATVLQSLSTRDKKAFLKLNCAALPDNLLESELFGYKRGAFTDARKDKPGLFTAAHKGTLFLDEIGEMSLPLQAKLLRAVETGEIFPLGATQPVQVDVRLIAATNKHLYQEVHKGNFREDLFYRLNVVNIHIPPLRERKTDIPLFIDHFIRHYNIIREKNVSSVSSEALEILLNHHYPGNIRELRNIMEYVFIFCSSGEVMSNHLPRYLTDLTELTDTVHEDRDETAPLPGNQSAPPVHAPTPTTGEAYEKKRILDALNQSHWNKSKTAQLLGMDRSTLWRKMKKFGLK